MTCSVVNDECREAMRQMDSDSVDAVVTDPPYAISFMGSGWDSFGKPTGKESTDERKAKSMDYAEENKGAPRYGNSHGHAPDRNENVAFQEAMTPVFEEALRVAKPGAYLLAFGSPRTFHRLACAIEDAGWEIRDCIMWVYGSGYPKGMNVSKAIDKTGGVDPEKSARALKAARERAGMSREDLASAIGCKECSVSDWEDGRSRKSGLPREYITPSKKYRDKLIDILGFTDDERVVIGATTDRRGDGTVYGIGHSGNVYGGPVSEFAKKWDGWNTALKPAWEPIIVARKPLDGTVAHNVSEWGVGAMNIDGCRVGTETMVNRPAGNKAGGNSLNMSKYGMPQDAEPITATGRFPANLVHDGSQEVLGLFPNESGRFFYCAKASKKDRGEGNDHPTVKPNALMRWLVRLVCPQGGMVLDPFMGSGSTGVACMQEGMSFVGVEMNPHYCDIAKARIDAAFWEQRQMELPL